MTTTDRTELSYWRGLADEACPHLSHDERQALAERMYRRVMLRQPVDYSPQELTELEILSRIVQRLDNDDMNESADDPPDLVLGGQGRTGDDLRDDGGAWLVAALALAIVGGAFVAIAWTVLP